MRLTCKDLFKKTFLPIIFFLFLIFNTLLLFLPNIYLKLTKRYLLFFNGLGIGDALVFTSAIKYLHNKEKVRFIIFSLYPEVFYNLEGVDKNIKVEKNILIKTLYYFLESSNYSNIISCYGGNIYYKRFSFFYEDEYSYYGDILRNNKLYLMHVFLFPRKDFLKKIKSAKLNPIISFTKKELEYYKEKFKNIIIKKYSIVNSGTSTIIKSKNLGYSKMNEIIKKTNKITHWIQVGTKKDKCLNNISLDLRNKTSLRELFFLVSRSNFTFTNEGLITHISAAFKVPCITIYTGYHYPEISLYKSTIPITPKILPSCAYCFKERCFKSKQVNIAKCSKNISVNEIIKNVYRLVDYNPIISLNLDSHRADKI